MKELTFDNLEKIILKRLGFDDIKFTKDTVLRTYIDGDDVIYLLEELMNKFNVTFENFDFTRYYHEESEIIKVINWFGIKKMRKIEHELTMGELFEYMKNNKK
ncbi:DUF1493 family protein [Apibacter mensalis]|uniref:DUF1493 family protein n=1 Tax=Apibacter mensalis TaxID=1586267 RepID=UPI0026EFD3C8|nr:DUF1493 family protein [Apibacter mensalis]